MSESTSVPTGPLWCPEMGVHLRADLSVPQVAAVIGKSQRTMYRPIPDGQLLGTAIRGGDIRTATVPLLAACGLTVGQHAA